MIRVALPLLLSPMIVACELEPETPSDAAPRTSPSEPAAPVAAPQQPTPSPTPAIEPERTDVDPKHAIVVDFDPEQTGIYLSVELEGPSGHSKRLDYLFDTGASFTTITRETARELGVEIPADAPRLEFDTAAGKRSDPMVQLPALKLGSVRIPSLAVSICDPCATRRGAGLLGLNVIREFVIQTDYQTSQMRLLPRVYPARPNRAYDIQPMLALDVDGVAQVLDGQVEWIVSAKNQSAVVIEGVIPRVNFENGTQLRGEPIARIEPGAIGRSKIAGKVLDDGQDGGALSYTLSLAEAHW
ncbi:MAG TPA: retropepsin-like aspartic protease [Enhygromyxa sp.]|nr:retropepsin-like aspartic protease [Enhygromyxa sp.]